MLEVRTKPYVKEECDTPYHIKIFLEIQLVDIHVC